MSSSSSDGTRPRTSYALKQVIFFMGSRSHGDGPVYRRSVVLTPTQGRARGAAAARMPFAYHSAIRRASGGDEHSTPLAAVQPDADRARAAARAADGRRAAVPRGRP